MVTNMNRPGKSDLSCCKVIQKYKYVQSKNFIDFMDLGAGGAKISSNDILISHIRYCCGHEYFITELLGEYSEDGSYDYIDPKYFIYLALILHKDFHDSHLYEKLCSCVPILKRMMFSDKDIIRLDNYLLYKALSECSPIEPDIIINLMVCINELELLQKLLDNVAYISIYSEDISKLIELGYDLPSDIMYLQNKITSLMRYEKEITEAYEAQDSNKRCCTSEIYKIRPCLRIITYPMGGNRELLFDLQVLLVYNDNQETILWDNYKISKWSKIVTDLNIEPFVDKERLFEDFTGEANIGDIYSLLNSLCGSEVNIYI